MLTFHSFEVEGFEKVGNDTVFDIAILPNRAHDAFSHWSLAWEIGVLLGGKRLKKFLKGEEIPLASTRPLSVVLEEPELCFRYTGRVLENVTVGESPVWLKERLAAIGQRSINAAVDAANYVMFSIGQPLHVFDADKISGSTIFVRKAKEGEKITTLDRKEVSLDPSVLVIADEDGPLAIAGIKGGTRAEVDQNTKNIIIEAANFQNTNIRKTAKRLGLRTDASIRYEHELTSHLVEPAMHYLTELLLECGGTPKTKVGAVVDVYPRPEAAREITVTPHDVERLLGVSLSEEEIGKILDQIGLSWKPGLVVQVPPTRLDLALPADMVEEIGRVYGYDKIPGIVVPPLSKPTPLKSYFYSEEVRSLLAENGFSEVYTYSFVGSGEVEVQNPLAQGLGFMRAVLGSQISDRLAFNIKNKDLLELDEVRIFEIGTVYLKNEERKHLVLGSSNKKTDLAAFLLWPVENLYKGSENILEVNFTQLLESLPDAGALSDLEKYPTAPGGYAPINPYPCVSRDVAVFVPSGTAEAEVIAVIDAEKGPLAVRGPRLFDRFEKEGKISYAFRLVFQAPDRTLTGEEVQERMDAISKALTEKGWQVR